MKQTCYSNPPAAPSTPPMSAPNPGCPIVLPAIAPAATPLIAPPSALTPFDGALLESV